MLIIARKKYLNTKYIAAEGCLMVLAALPNEKEKSII